MARKDLLIKSKRRLSPRALLLGILAGILCTGAAFCHSVLRGAEQAQTDSIRENADAYSSLMDERISVDLHGFMELNLDPALESSPLRDFFFNPVSVSQAGGFPAVRRSAAECVDLANNLDGLILYRTSDNTLLSTLNDYYHFAKINPAYPYLMSAIAQTDGSSPSFIHYQNGSVLYYYPIVYQDGEAGKDSHVSDCIIAILHKSEDFLGVDISPSSSYATFAVLREGQVLSVEGHNPLSDELVASVAGLARSTSGIYTYEDTGLNKYYFYIVDSGESELEYCYYEPALTGLALFRHAFAPWSRWLPLLLLLTAAVLCLILLIAALRARPSEDSGEEPAPPAPENIFGTLLNFSGIIIDCYCGGEPSTPELLDRIDRIVCDNFTFTKLAYQATPHRHGDYLEYYINYNVYNMRVLSDSLKMNLFNEVPECSVNIFYSGAVPTLQKAEDDLFYLRKHLHYSLVLGYWKRLSIQQIQRFEQNTEILDANVSSTVQGFLRTGAYDDFYAYMNHYKDITDVYSHSYNFTTWYSFSERYRFAEEAFTTVKLFFQENGFSHPIAHATCNSVLRAKPGFGNLCQYLISCVQDYQQENQHNLSDRSRQLMNAIYKFIDEDLAGANLSSIARKMQMTDSHLSRMFKKNTGFNFSEYLTERRLEEAARLLLQDNKLKVADISETLGYGNPTYFLSRFKAKYGVSPSAYRKAHIMERESSPEPPAEAAQASQPAQPSSEENEPEIPQA